MGRTKRPALPAPERQPKLLFVRLHLDKNLMEVGVEDPLWNKRRIVRYRWMKRDQKGVPPERWFEAICGEVEFQRQQDFNRKLGRVIP